MVETNDITEVQATLDDLIKAMEQRAQTFDFSLRKVFLYAFNVSVDSRWRGSLMVPIANVSLPIDTPNPNRFQCLPYQTTEQKTMTMEVGDECGVLYRNPNCRNQIVNHFLPFETRLVQIGEINGVDARVLHKGGFSARLFNLGKIRWVMPGDDVKSNGVVHMDHKCVCPLLLKLNCPGQYACHYCGKVHNNLQQLDGLAILPGS